MTEHQPTSSSAVTSPRIAIAVLLVGVGLVVASIGLQGSLIGVRGSMEGFSPTALGAVIASYYIGFVGGSIVVPELLGRVGHIRVFAALSSTASGLVLLHALSVTPLSWLLLRAVIGFCSAGIYIVAESWLNDLVDNESRGRIFAVYMMVVTGALAVGQILLNVADPRGFHLFVVASVIVSFALVPMALAASASPRVPALSSMRVRDLFAIAPLGVIGTLAAGVSYSALVGMGAVFGAAAGLSVGAISALVAVSVLGGMAGQWPISRLSDSVDRRAVIAATSLAAAGLAVFVATVVASPMWLLVGIAGFGFLSIPLYPLSVAHVNDWVERDQIVKASGTLILLLGVGSIVGPLLASLALAAAGPVGFMWMLAGIHVMFGLHALHRLTVRGRSPRQVRSLYVSAVARAASVAGTFATKPVGRRPPRSAD